MSFDKNKDGKVTKDELPERMQNLIARGDSNKDGALDSAEIKSLATDLARDGAFGPGPRGRGPGRGFPPGSAIDRAVDDLNLSGKKNETAEAAVKAHQDNVRKLTDLARADLLLKMTEVLNEEELKTFKVALDRPAGFAAGPNGRGGRGPGPGSPDLERRLDQLQRDLENLRREIRR
jgi:hypothetical protein